MQVKPVFIVEELSFPGTPTGNGKLLILTLESKSYQCNICSLLRYL